MKRKTIAKIIANKVNAYIKSIDDEELVKEMREGLIVTGGCIPSMFLNEDVNDYDIYFRSPELAEKVARYYLKQMQESREANEKNNELEIRKNMTNGISLFIKSAGVTNGGDDTEYNYYEQDPSGNNAENFLNEKFEGADKSVKYGLLYASSNAITLNNGIQLVLRFAGEPDVIHKNYDFVHCTGYWTSWDREVVMTEAAFESILTRELRYTGSLFPICSMIRLRKFITRGWHINAGQMLKIAYQINELDLTDNEVLSEQLVGVDTAYFSELIDLIREEKKNGKTIDSSYIAQIVDKVFD